LAVVFGQPARRLAIVEANGPAARSNGGIALVESRLTDELTAKLAGRPGLTLVDRASIDRILKEQNFQNSDRSSADTAVRIGKLLGVGQMLLVQVVNASYTQHQEGSGNTVQTIGTVALRANARMVDVETGVILSEPVSSFQDSVQVSETQKSQGFQFGTMRVPPKTKVTGGDPKVIQDNEWDKAVDAVTADLATKMTTSIASAPVAAMAPPLVAGIANGAVYINEGANAGIKAGDRFQVIRSVSVGLNDPTTGQPMVQKQSVCVLTITTVNDANASGSCDGGLPQSKDVAQPMK
jgi:hypothetical protein